MRDWKTFFRTALFVINLILIVAIVAVLLLNYVIGVWPDVTAWIPRAMFGVGCCSISVALCMEDE